MSCKIKLYNLVFAAYAHPGHVPKAGIAHGVALGLLRGISGYIAAAGHGGESPGAVGVGDGVPSGVGLGTDIVPRAVISGGGSDLQVCACPRQRSARGVALGVVADGHTWWPYTTGSK